MSLPKPKKYCKNCKLKIENELANNPMGLSKFCSINCFYRFKQTTKTIKPEKAPEIKVSRNRVKRTTKVQQKLDLGKPIEKEILDRDPKYLDFIRKQKCLVCGASKPHAHHLETGGVGIKGSDYSCVPLCNEHHTDGTDAYHRIGRTEFENKFKLDLNKEVNKCLRNYIRTLTTS